MKPAAFILVLSLLLQGACRANFLEPPALEAGELASALDFRWVKGHLLQKKGFEIDTVQLLFKDSSGERKLLSEKLAVDFLEGRYEDTGELVDPLGYLLVMTKPVEGGYEIQLQIQTRKCTSHLKILVPELAGASFSKTCQFDVSTRRKTTDPGYVVPVGETEVFTFSVAGKRYQTISVVCEAKQ